jgi:hypothetical protein
LNERRDGLGVLIWRWRERWKAWWNREKPLREFVYLDETSVYSLYASRFGEIPSERTDTLTQVRQSEVGGSLSPAANVSGARLTARAMSSQSQQSQVVSRAIVQSTFKDLLEKERKSLSLRHVPHFEKTPRVQNLGALSTGERPSRRLKKLRKKGFVIDPLALTRGALLEIEVELESEFVFRFSSVVQEFAGMFGKNPALFGQDEEQIAEFSSISDIVERLLVGLIPLRSRAVDYSVVVFDASEDEKLVVHNRLLEGLQEKGGFTTHPLFVVGVTEQALFWKDIRRVLFAGQRFRVLCRVARDGVDGSWVPLKLQEVVSSVFPEIGQEIEKVSRGDMFKAELDGAGGGDADREGVVRNALRLHACRLAEHNGVSLSEDDIDSIGVLALERAHAFATMQEKREAFRAIENLMVDRHDLKVDAETVADSRRRAREETDAAPESIAADPASEFVVEAPSDPETSDEYFLDSEFIAIYW